jgi:sporulation protein YqfC
LKNYRKKSNNFRRVSTVVSEKTGLPVDVLDGYPQIKLYCGRELIIEGRCRISEYTPETVRAVCRRVKITVSGRALTVKLMDEQALVVCGVIQSVSFEE